MEAKRTLEPGEVFVPFVPDRAHAPMATHVRSTLIASSVASLRARGLFDAYRANLAPALRDELPATIAGLWAPIERGLAHYDACDRLRLPVAELLTIGESVGARSTQSALSLAAKLAAGGGATPWTVIAQSRRLWERMFQGSSVGVMKIGPKEARMEMIAWPLARIAYNRISYRGILTSMIKPFCTQVYVSEVPQLCTSFTAGYRIAWA